MTNQQSPPVHGIAPFRMHLNRLQQPFGFRRILRFVVSFVTFCSNTGLEQKVTKGTKIHTPDRGVRPYLSEPSSKVFRTFVIGHSFDIRNSSLVNVLPKAIVSTSEGIYNGLLRRAEGHRVCIVSSRTPDHGHRTSVYDTRIVAADHSPAGLSLTRLANKLARMKSIA